MVISVACQCEVEAERVFACLTSGRFFELTGADEVQVDFRLGGGLRLDFNDRGHITGTFNEIVRPSLVRFSWTVEGFGRETEVATEVTVQLSGDRHCRVTIEHVGVTSAASAVAKRRAWAELLAELQSDLTHVGG